MHVHRTVVHRVGVTGVRPAFFSVIPVLGCLHETTPPSGPTEPEPVTSGSLELTVEATGARPDVDGYELLEQLKQMPKMDGIPAIAISGYASDEDRRKAISVGYLALVPKPIDVDALFSLIDELKIPAGQP